ncbi:hypothetical protein [Mycobacterium sp. SMC-17]|uniref:hypothetical protein n=1 Tax=Mycobacterium sp. SMC-17 TaxID=3381628 RepID=UPI0038776462
MDDKLHSHHKPRKAGLEAMGLWAVCLSYSGDQLTDGWVPEWYVTTWAPGVKGKRLAANLVQAGLWEPSRRDGEKGWMFHDYARYNPSRDKVLADREAERLRKAKWRESAALQRAREEADDASGT